MLTAWLLDFRLKGDRNLLFLLSTRAPLYVIPSFVDECLCNLLRCPLSMSAWREREFMIERTIRLSRMTIQSRSQMQCWVVRERRLFVEKSSVDGWRCLSILYTSEQLDILWNIRDMKIYLWTINHQPQGVRHDNQTIIASRWIVISKLVWCSFVVVDV